MKSIVLSKEVVYALYVYIYIYLAVFFLEKAV